MEAEEQTTKCTSMWIHCNRCFENYLDKQRPIYILSCYDVVCEKCLTIVNERQVNCPICKNTVRGCPIGNNLPPNLKEYFHPRPWTLDFVKAVGVVKFQTKHRDHFLLGCDKLAEYNKALGKERDRIKEECKKVYLYQQQLKKKKEQLEAVLKKIIARKRAQKSVNKSFHSEMSFEIRRAKRHHSIPSTCQNLSRPRYDDTFDFPIEDTFSKSFYL